MAEEDAAWAVPGDVEERWRPLSDAEVSRARALIGDAQAVVAAELAQGGVDPASVSHGLLKTVVCQMTVRAMASSEEFAGAANASTSLGDYTRSMTFSGAAGGDLYLTRGERRLLGLDRRLVSSVRPRREAR